MILRIQSRPKVSGSFNIEAQACGRLATYSRDAEMRQDKSKRDNKIKGYEKG